MMQGDSVELPVVFDKNFFNPDNLPKSILNRWITQNNLTKPNLKTYSVEKQFHSVIHFMGKYYSTPYLEKTKRHSEQSAALVLLLSLGLCNDATVREKCLVTERNCVHALTHHENGRRYMIKINK